MWELRGGGGGGVAGAAQPRQEGDEAGPWGQASRRRGAVGVGAAPGGDVEEGAGNAIIR